MVAAGATGGAQLASPVFFLVGSIGANCAASSLLSTSGGRVLCVCGLGADVGAAQAAAYAALARISWEGAHFRSDIGYRAISREQGKGA